MKPEQAVEHNILQFDILNPTTSIAISIYGVLFIFGMQGLSLMLKFNLKHHLERVIYQPTIF